jgi:carbon monoxide dehydrogenase subunit G
MAWTSQHPEVGNGRQEIVESEPPRRVRIAFDFGRQGSAAGSFTLRPEGEGTHVTWAFDTDLGSNPLARYFGLVLDDMIGPAYEKGLANLKKVAEAVGQ